MKEYHKEYRQKNRDKINKQLNEYYWDNPERYKIFNAKYRAEHKEQIAKSKKLWTERNQDKIKLSRKRYWENNKELLRQKTKKYYHRNKERFKEKTSIRGKQYARGIRINVMNHYGNKCQCCGESILEFLSIDHINNDGKFHRDEQGTGVKFYRWIIKNNYPMDLQILCFNCNFAKQIWGECPHNKNLIKVIIE